MWKPAWDVLDSFSPTFRQRHAQNPKLWEPRLDEITEKLVKQREEPTERRRQEVPEQYRRGLTPREPPLPSLPAMALTYAFALARHVAAGSPVVDEETYHARVAICEACPSFRRSDRRCAKCGCHLDNQVDKKTLWADAACPDAPPRWGTASAAAK